MRFVLLAVLVFVSVKSIVDKIVTIQSSGLTDEGKAETVDRKYYLYVPDGFQSEKNDFVFLFYDDNENYTVPINDWDWKTIADTNKFAIIVPEALVIPCKNIVLFGYPAMPCYDGGSEDGDGTRRWDIPHVLDGMSIFPEHKGKKRTSSTDSKFYEDIISDLTDVQSIEPKRKFAIGMRSGAFFAYYLTQVVTGAFDRVILHSGGVRSYGFDTVYDMAGSFGIGFLEDVIGWLFPRSATYIWPFFPEKKVDVLLVHSEMNTTGMPPMFVAMMGMMSHKTSVSLAEYAHAVKTADSKELNADLFLLPSDSEYQEMRTELNEEFYGYLNTGPSYLTQLSSRREDDGGNGDGGNDTFVAITSLTEATEYTVEGTFLKDGKLIKPTSVDKVINDLITYIVLIIVAIVAVIVLCCLACIGGCVGCCVGCFCWGVNIGKRKRIAPVNIHEKHSSDDHDDDTSSEELKKEESDEDDDYVTKQDTDIDVEKPVVHDLGDEDGEDDDGDGEGEVGDNEEIDAEEEGNDE